MKPVPEHLIAPLKPFLSDQVWAVIQLQILAGPRPEDVLKLRPIDLKVREKIWTAEPEAHKTAHREHQRILYFGPKAQAILQPFILNRAVNAFLFSPQEAEKTRRSQMHADRKTPAGFGNRPGTNRAAKPRIRRRIAIPWRVTAGRSSGRVTRHFHRQHTWPGRK